MSDMCEIRLAEVEDSDAIASLLQEAFAEFATDYTPEAFAVVTPPADEIAGRFAEGPQWLALVDGTPVGTVSVLPEPEHLYIRSMAVSPAAQGKGVAGKLLEAVEEYANGRGFDRLFLYTTYFSKAAIKLYERYGFVHERDTPAEEWYGTAGLAMAKKILGKGKQNVAGS